MAGLIPQYFIDDLLARTDIVEVIDSRVPLKKAGTNYKACCPFHNEKTPSFSVSETKQFYHCFGCGESGSALRFLMEYEHLSFPEAVDELARNLGLEVPHEKVDGTEHVAKVKQADSLYQLMQRVDQFYRKQLREHPQAQKAVQYLKQRGLSGEIAAEYGMGYAPPGYESVLKALAESAATEGLEQKLVEVGVLINNDRGGTYDRFRDRVMFPIRDQRGRCIAFGGRVLGDESPKYLNSPETPLFHKGRELYGLYEMRKALRKIEKVVVVEGYMDVVALAQFGVRYAVATLGTATTAEHLQRLFRISHEIYFCFDGDRAGRDAAWRALNNALPVMREGLQIRFMFLPQGEDPDSYIRANGKDGFEAELSKSKTFSEYLFENLCANIDTHSIDGRAQLVEQARPLLGQLLPGVYRQMVLKQLAQLARMEAAEIEAIFQNQAGQNRSGQNRSGQNNIGQSAPPNMDTAYQAGTSSAKQGAYATQKSRSSEKSGLSPIRKAIMRLLHMPSLAQLVSVPNQLAELDMPGIDILRKLLELLHANPHINCAAILERWSSLEETQQSYPHLLKLAQWQPELEDEASLEAEFLGVMNSLYLQAKEMRLEHLLAKSNHGHLDAQEKQELKHLTQRTT